MARTGGGWTRTGEALARALPALAAAAVLGLGYGLWRAAVLGLA